MKAVDEAGPQLSVEQLEHRDPDQPGEQGNDLVSEAADDADGAAADQEQEDEDVERGHVPGASLGEQPFPVPC